MIDIYITCGFGLSCFYIGTTVGEPNTLKDCLFVVGLLLFWPAFLALGLFLQAKDKMTNP